jgi:hypothetical protein
VTNGRTYSAKQIENKREKDRKLFAARKKQAYDHYGRKCVCCGEEHVEFLSIDHVYGKGAAQRKELSNGKGMYKWLIDNGFPEGYQVLCMNCNHARGRKGGDGLCPHERERKERRLFA